MGSIGIIAVLRNGTITANLRRWIADHQGSIRRDGGFFIEITIDPDHLNELKRHPDILIAADGNVPFKEVFNQ